MDIFDHILSSRKLLSIIFLSRENTLNRLLELSNEIFRIKTDDYTFPLFSSLHFKIILCVVITIFIAIIFKEKIKKWRYRRAFEIITALILISTQIFLAISKYLKYSSSSKLRKVSLKFKIIFFSPLT